MRANADRVEKAVHYVIARTDPAELGSVKLNKILWYSDLEHYRRYGQSLTGLSEYTRMPQGPMSKDISQALRRLSAAGAIHVRKVPVFDYTRHEHVALKEPNVEDFTPNQIDILNIMIDVIRKMTAEGVSEVTHDALWKELQNDEPMPVRAGAVIRRPATEADIDWARQLSA
jgi:hypothetical protein